MILVYAEVINSKCGKNGDDVVLSDGSAVSEIMIPVIPPVGTS